MLSYLRNGEKHKAAKDDLLRGGGGGGGEGGGGGGGGLYGFVGLYEVGKYRKIVTICIASCNNILETTNNYFVMLWKGCVL